MAVRLLTTRLPGATMQHRKSGPTDTVILRGWSFMPGVVNCTNRNTARRAATALDYRVTGSSLPLEVSYRVLGGDDVLKRIIFMNFGTSAHEIRPSGTWSLTGRRGGLNVRFGGGERVATQPVLAWTDRRGQVVTPEVYHPGQRGTGFLERGMQAAKDRNRG